MKLQPGPLLTLIESGQFQSWDCYKISTVSSGALTLTNANFDIAGNILSDWNADWGPDFGGPPFTSKGIAVDMKGSRQLASWATGLDPDTWQLMLLPRVVDPMTGTPFPDTVGNQPFVSAARSGVFDQADVTIYRCYFSHVPKNPIRARGALPVGSIIVFKGLVGQCDANDSLVVMACNDYKAQLTQQMPRNLYQAGCRNALFDTRCTLSRAAYLATGVAATGSTQGLIIATGVAAPAGSGTYNLGRIVMTSGANAGFQRMVSNWDGVSNFALLSPFPFAIAPGDTFNISPGCDKRSSTCAAFGNAANFNGEPWIPMPETILG